MEQTNMETNMDIPIEVIGDIFNYLKPGSLHRIASYSKMARYVVNNYINRYRYICMWKPYYTWFSLDKYNRVDDNDYSIEYVLNNFWYYRLSFNHNTYPELLAVIGKVKNKNLFIDISSSNIEDISVLADINTLDISACHNIKNVSALENVYDLTLDRCENVRDIGMLGNVHTLSLIECDIILEGIYNLGNVYSLDLSYTYVNDSILSSGILSNVCNLKLTCCQQITDIGFGSGTLSNIHTLILDETQITDKGLIDGALGNVYMLDLKFTNVTEEGILRLGSVDILDIPDCQHGNNNNVVGNCIYMLGSVYKLNASSVSFITDEVLCSGVLGGIHELDLSYCKNITDKGMCSGALANIDILCLNNTDITDITLNSGVLANIHMLDLSYCINITDDGLNMGVFTNVHDLSLTGCDKITDVGICKGALSHLYRLDLSWCNNITDKSVSKLDNIHILALMGWENIDRLSRNLYC